MSIFSQPSQTGFSRSFLLGSSVIAGFSLDLLHFLACLEMLCFLTDTHLPVCSSDQSQGWNPWLGADPPMTAARVRSLTGLFGISYPLLSQCHPWGYQPTGWSYTSCWAKPVSVPHLRSSHSNWHALTCCSASC